MPRTEEKPAGKSSVAMMRRMSERSVRRLAEAVVAAAWRMETSERMMERMRKATTKQRSTIVPIHSAGRDDAETTLQTEFGSCAVMPATVKAVMPHHVRIPTYEMV